MIGEEFKTARLHLLKNLEGNIAWKDPAQAVQQRERLLQQRQEREHSASSAVGVETVREEHQQQELVSGGSMEMC